MEMQFGNDTELVALEVTHFTTDLAFLVLDRETLAGSGGDAQLRVELREHGFYERAKTIHDAEHTDHSGCDHTYRSRTDAADDIDGIVSLLGEEVPPCYMSL